MLETKKMKYNNPRIALFTLFAGVILFMSCQSDGDAPDEMNLPEEEFTISEEAIIKGDPLIDEILKITTINGSKDDVLDGLPQSRIELPVNISMNGQSFMVENDEGIAIAKVVADYSTQDDDKVTFEYPIKLYLNDFTERTIQNEEGFLAVKNEYQNKPNYNGINGANLIYPISFMFFNTVSKERGTLVVRNNEDMLKLLDNLLDSDVLELKYPVKIQSEFENTIINVIDNTQLSNEINSINNEYETQQLEEPTGKVIVCHNVSNNPRNLEVNINALSAHLRHGDRIGSCQ